MTKRIFVFLSMLIVASIMLAACKPANPVPAECSANPTGCAVIKAGETIKIGMAGPMTGDYAAFGTDISQGGQLAIDKLGTLDSWKFELVTEDTQGAPEAGAAVANKWATNPNLVAVAGHIFSGETEAAMPIYAKAGIPMFSPSATNADLTKSGSPVFNRICFTDTVQSQKAANYLFNTLGIKKLAVMHDGGAYGQALAEATAKVFQALGGEVVATQAINPGEADYSAALAAVAAAGPEALYYGGYDAEGAVLINGMKVAGLEGVIFFGCDGTYGENILKLTGANSEGAYAAVPFPADTPAKLEFDAAYEAKWGTKAGVLSPFSWNGYDVVAALVTMTKQVAIKGEDGNLYVPREALVKAVRTMKDLVFTTGNITCDATGECNTVGPTFYVVKDGKWVQAPK